MSLTHYSYSQWFFFWNWELLRCSASYHSECLNRNLPEKDSKRAKTDTNLRNDREWSGRFWWIVSKLAVWSITAWFTCANYIFTIYNIRLICQCDVWFYTIAQNYTFPDPPSPPIFHFSLITRIHGEIFLCCHFVN